MRIGIITPAFDAASTLAGTIASVVAQTHQDWRMIVVDDGSRDGTRDVAGSFADPRVSTVHQDNAGVSAARNRGFRSLCAQAYLFLDADDRLAPTALATLIATLAECAWASAAVGAYCFVDGTGPASGTRPATGGDLVEALVRRNRFVNGGHLLIRAEAMALAGGFDPTLRYGEDWEFWVRVALTGEFAASRCRRPILHVRQRPDGAYAQLAADPAAFEPCMAAVFANPDLAARVGSGRLSFLRRAASAEHAWVAGREMIRHGRTADGVAWLLRSVRLWPSVRRLALLAAVPLVLQLPRSLRGALRPYVEQGL